MLLREESASDPSVVVHSHGPVHMKGRKLAIIPRLAYLYLLTVTPCRDRVPMVGDAFLQRDSLRLRLRGG